MSNEAMPNTTSDAIPHSGTQFQSVVVQNHVVMGLAAKSPLVAFLLAFFFGPLGMLYSTVVGAIVMFVIDVILVIPTAGLIFFITGPIGCVWAVLAAR